MHRSGLRNPMKMQQNNLICEIIIVDIREYLSCLVLISLTS